MLRHLSHRPRLVAALALGVAVGLIVPAPLALVTRALIGWNAGVWTYLLLIAWKMTRGDNRHIERDAKANAEGTAVMMITAIGAVLASVAAIVVEMAGAHEAGRPLAIAHVAFTAATLAGSWLLLATLFALHYASQYHSGPHGGLEFPGMAADADPGYADFLYFSFTIACTSQTSDVAIASPAIRRWVLAHSVLSFAFNTMLLALAINIGASLL